MHYTTIEQSKKLLELGLNPETADMFYSRKPTGKSDYGIFPDFKPRCRLEVFTEADLPCWSLSALLELIPHTGFDGIELNNYNDGKTIWTAIFHWKTNPIRIADTPLDAVYEVVVWLLKNGYIKNELIK